MKDIKLHDKEFRVSIDNHTITTTIDVLSDKINEDLQDKNPVFICVLNGGFMFATEVLKRFSQPCEVTFIKLASYSGVKSTGTVKTLLGLDTPVEGRTVVILEDIVDSGNTVDDLLKKLQKEKPAEIKIATLLFKPNAFKKKFKIDYSALDVPNDFIVGFGLDYRGLGRNLPDIYTLITE